MKKLQDLKYKILYKIYDWVASYLYKNERWDPELTIISHNKRTVFLTIHGSNEEISNLIVETAFTNNSNNSERFREIILNLPLAVEKFKLKENLNKN